MSWLFELHRTQPVAHAIGVQSLICVLGMGLGSFKFRGIGLGTAGVLLAGLALGRFGEPVDHDTLGLRQRVRAHPLCLHHRSATWARLLCRVPASGCKIQI